MQQFMRPRSRDKKLTEEWVVPLKNIEDIYEVCVPVVMYPIFEIVNVIMLWNMILKSLS